MGLQLLQYSAFSHVLHIVGCQAEGTVPIRLVQRHDWIISCIHATISYRLAAPARLGAEASALGGPYDLEDN